MDAVHSPSSMPLAVTPGGWRERLAARIDRWSTSPALHRWAMGSVMTRWLVRRRSARLFACMAGFVHTQVLLACVRLHLLETLAESPRTLDELAALTGLQAASLQRLLDSAVAMGLMNRRSCGRYGLGALGAPVAAHAGIREMVEHNATLYDDLRDPLALLRDPNQAQMHTYWPYTPHQPRDGAPAETFSRYSALTRSCTAPCSTCRRWPNWRANRSAGSASARASAPKAAASSPTPCPPAPTS